MVSGLPGGIQAKASGLVFDSAHQPGLAEPSATQLKDYSRWKNHGTFKADGHPNWVWTGKLWVMDFNSAAPDYVTIPASATQLNFTSEDFSIIARVKIDDIAFRNIFCRGADSSDGYRFYIRSIGNIRLLTSQFGIFQTTTSSPGSIIAATWYTIGCSRSGAIVSLFINGVEDTDVAGTHINPATCNRSAKIGIYDDLSIDSFDGKMGFIQIYRYALSAGQHLKIHNAWKDWV